MRKYMVASSAVMLFLVFSLYGFADGGVTLRGGGVNSVDTGRLSGAGYTVQSSVGQAVSGQSTGEGYQVISNPPIEEPPQPDESKQRIYLPVVLK